MTTPDTQPDAANPWAETSIAPAQLRQQIEAAFERSRKKKNTFREPDLLWEEAGLHGTGRQVKLQGNRPPRATNPKRHDVAPAALPPLPDAPLVTGRTAAIAIGVAATGTLAWFLWKRRQAKKSRALSILKAIPT